MVRESPISVLLAGDYSQEDEVLIRAVCGNFGWRVSKTSEDGHRHHPGDCRQVVIAQSDAPNWNWRSLLREMQLSARPSQLIVTSRTADERLWAEVLNLGGYDVLVQPLDRHEVERVIASAARHTSPPPSRLPRRYGIRFY